MLNCLKYVVALITLLIATPSYATVDWTEGFEYTTYAQFVSNGTGPWDTSCPTDDTVIAPSTDIFYSGARSAKFTHYGHQAAGGQPATPGYKSCIYVRTFNADSPRIFTRYYIYITSGWVTDYLSSKIWRVERNNTFPGIWSIFWSGGMALSYAVEGVVRNGVIDTQNVYGGAALPRNQWVCVENEMYIGTPGVADAGIRQWNDGAPVMNRMDVLGRMATDTSANGPNSQWRQIKLYVQDGVGIFYIDDFAVSRDARIGCSGTPPPSDTTPPTAPTALGAS